MSVHAPSKEDMTWGRLCGNCSHYTKYDGFEGRCSVEHCRLTPNWTCEKFTIQ